MIKHTVRANRKRKSQAEHFVAALKLLTAFVNFIVIIYLTHFDWTTALVRSKRVRDV